MYTLEKYQAFGYKAVVRYSSFLFIASLDSSVKAKWTPLKRICFEIAWWSFYLSVIDCNTYTYTQTNTHTQHMLKYGFIHTVLCVVNK